MLNVAYKVLSKVIVNRIRPLLQQLVGPLQGSFLPGRSTADNIILTQETIHSMTRLKGRRGAMALKIDLHKAFDSVSWSFLREVLHHFNFPPPLIELIMFSISSNRLSILWNGCSLPPFSPGRGLRQGDPLSPYLFILVMEKLSHMIQDAVREGAWKPFKLSQGGFSLSHLFFADDLMLFAEASVEQISNIMDILLDFAGQSGLQLSVGKSKLFTSDNTSLGLARALSSTSGIPVTSDLGVYLGVPIKHGRLSSMSYQYLLDRIKSKLALWKKNTLSFAGRRVFVQSTTSTIANYAMQTQLLPVAVTSSIDRNNRSFLWGDTELRLRPHLVKWERICQSRDRGGLNIREARLVNLSLLAKLGWRVASGDNPLWCAALKSKYLRNASFWDVPQRQNSSGVWNSILASRDIVRRGTRWRIGSNSLLNFWTDAWLPEGPLASCMQEQVPEASRHLRIVDFLHEEGTWNLQTLNEHLPHHLVEVVRTIPVPVTIQIPDEVYWGLSTTGLFTVKSAFDLLRNEKAVDECNLQKWGWVSRLFCSEKIKSFIWFTSWMSNNKFLSFS